MALTPLITSRAEGYGHLESGIPFWNAGFWYCGLVIICSGILWEVSGPYSGLATLQV